jgi:hypothetical protein
MDDMGEVHASDFVGAERKVWPKIHLPAAWSLVVAEIGNVEAISTHTYPLFDDRADPTVLVRPSELSEGKGLDKSLFQLPISQVERLTQSCGRGASNALLAILSDCGYLKSNWVERSGFV